MDTKVPYPETCTCLWLQVSLDDVVASFINPSLLDSCEEYLSRQALGLQSSLGAGNVSAPNATSVSISGPVRVNVLVQAGNTQETGGYSPLLPPPSRTATVPYCSYQRALWVALHIVGLSQPKMAALYEHFTNTT